jgi:hypothetical protein
LEKDEIELLDSDSEEIEENSGKTAEKEEEGDDNDMTEQATVPSHQGVHKQNLVMNQLGGGVHDITDDTSDDVIRTPPIPQGISKWGQVTGQTNSNIHPLMTGNKKQNVAHHIHKNLTPYSVFMWYFAVVITLLVEETNRYYQQYLHFLDNEPSPTPATTECEMFLFLAIIIQMGKYIHDNLKDYWSTTEQFFSPFNGKTTRHDRSLHI